MFKKSILSLLFWSSMGLFAQTNNKFTGFRSGADVVLKGISQYPPESGILYSRVLPASGLGQNKAGEQIQWNAAKFAQAIYELESACLTPPSNPIGKKLFRDYQKASMNGNLQLLAFCTKADVIDTSRIIDSSLVLENRTFKFKPRLPGQSPFRKQTLSGAAVMCTLPLIAGKTYQFFYPRNIQLGPEAKSLLQAKIRFNGGAWEPIQASQPMQKSFSVAGNLETEIQLSWEGGLVETYSSPLSISTEDPCLNPDLFMRPDDCPDWFSNPEFAPNWPASAIQATIAHLGVKGKGELFHYLRSGNNSGSQNPTYRDPIILVDGIDFGDTRKGETIYGKYLSYLPAGGGASVRLGSQLRSQGHDIIVLNFPDGRIAANVAAGTANPNIDGGCDYIERNAMVLVRLIQLVNQRLEPGSKKLSIAGPSMGGLIARYALAYMEKNQSSTGNHNCGLFISQDSPHLGANIPVGLQQLIQNLSQFNVAEAEEAWENLKSPAACELLIHHASHPEASLQNELRGTFLQNSLNNSQPGSFGWPKDPGLRMVALANGNDAGFGVLCRDNPPASVEGSAEMLSFHLQLRNKAVMAFVMAIFGNGTQLPPSAFFLTGKMGWKSRYSPAQNANGTTFEYNFGLSFIGQEIEILSDNTSWQAFDAGISLDGVPGGTSNTTEILGNSLASALGGGFNLIQLNVTHADKYHSFVPTKSALGFHWNTDGLRNPAEYLRERNLTCTGEVPFHAYYCATGNESHIRLNEASASFISSQLNYSPAPGGVPYPAEINGPKAVPAGSATFFSATYQGNLEFRNSWNITQVSGISATLSNPFSRTCKVLVSSGAGQENGFFMLGLTTEVKSLNGEWVCAGRKSQKVQVRKVAFMGSITWSCVTDLAQGCNFKIYSGTPNYDNLTNGVVHQGYEWQLSKFQDTDFGPSCWNGALSISPGSSSNGRQKAIVTLSNAFGIGNVFIYYARVRNLMRIPNPDYGMAGEPEFLTIGGSWKMTQLESEVLAGPSCIPCPGALVAEPENPVLGQDEIVTITASPEMPSISRLQIFNEANRLVFETNMNGTHTAIPLKNFIPGAYKVKLLAGESQLETEFWLQAGTDARLMASPEILRKGIDKNVRFRILDEHFLERGTGFWQAKLSRNGTASGTEWTGYLQNFSLAATELEPGNYQLSIDNGEEILQSSFTVIAENQEAISLYPNPASNSVHVSIPGFEASISGARVRILNLFGMVKLDQEIGNGSFDLDLSALTPDLYILQVIEGSQMRQVWFHKE